MAGGKDEFTWPFVDIAVAKGTSINGVSTQGKRGVMAQKHM